MGELVQLGRWHRLLVIFWAVAADCLPLAAPATTFVVEDDAFGEGSATVRLKVLRNGLTRERLEVAWNAGGRTEALVLRSPATGKLREVLLHSRRNATDVRSNTGWKGDMLMPYANRVKNGTYRLGGEEHHLARNEDRGPFGKNGLHGYLYLKELRVAHVRADNSSAELTLEHDFDGTDPGYPFPLSVALTYRLDASGFTLTTVARHRGLRGGPLPFLMSWHSYFLVGDVSRARIELDRCSGWNHILLSNGSNQHGDMIPTGETEPFVGFDGKSSVGGSSAAPVYWDDEFTATSPVQKCPRIATRIHDADAGDASVLWGDWQFRWVQVFTGTVQAFGEQAIAAEAMSGQCDSWNNLDGLRLLQPGEAWEGSLGVYLEGARAEPQV